MGLCEVGNDCSGLTLTVITIQINILKWHSHSDKETEFKKI